MTGKVIKTGDVSTYLVEYDEDAWNAFTKEQQDNCIKIWSDKARPMKCSTLTLRLHPDMLFPRREKEQPYMALTVQIAPNIQRPYTLNVLATVRIDTSVYNKVSEIERGNIIAAARREALKNLPTGGKYSIQCEQHEIERGRRE